MKTLTSRRNPIVTEYRRVATRRDPGEPAVLLDGPHLIEEAIEAGLLIRHAAIASARAEEWKALVVRLRSTGVDVALVTDRLMEALSPTRSPSGIVAIAERPGDALDRVFAAQPALVLIAAGIQDPGNLGAVVRAAEAGGASGLVACGGVDPFGWKALRGAMGSALRLPIAVIRQGARDEGRDATIDGGTPAAIDAARQRGLRVLGSSPRARRSLFDVKLDGPLAVVLGGEGAGVSDRTLALADEVFAIPMREPVESLNVAVSAGLIVYEVFRQRHALR
jgi:TrmH family RNA methyltransferase